MCCSTPGRSSAPSGDPRRPAQCDPGGDVGGGACRHFADGCATEAVADGVNGIVAPVETADAWVAALRRLSADDDLAERLRAGAREWVAENFDANRNAGRLLERFGLACR